MIFRHFADEKSGRHSYLFATPNTREAAIVNPVMDQLASYESTLAELDLRLVYTLETERDRRTAVAAAALIDRTGARRVAPSPASHGGGVGVDIEAKTGRGFCLGGLHVEIAEPAPGCEGEVAYRVTLYTFAGDAVLIDYHDAADLPDGEPDSLFDHARPASAPTAPSARTEPIRNYRRQREGVCVERMILEDLHTSLAEGRLTPKEERVVLAYIRCLEDNDWQPPSASQLSALLDNVDRTAVHVLVHNIRWKQIDLHRLPMVLAGQTSKWLKGLQAKPEFTPHEREFLCAYLRLLDDNPQPPSGPEIAAVLGRRSVQWVRKRAHTIRGKQREFNMPELILSRKSPRQNDCTSPIGPGPRPVRFDLDFDLHYSA